MSSSKTVQFSAPIIISMVFGITIVITHNLDHHHNQYQHHTSSTCVNSWVLSALETIGDTPGREMRSHSRYNAECHQNFEMVSHPIIIISLIHHHNH